MGNLGRGGERLLDPSRLLGSQIRPLIIVLLFLWFSVVWKIIIISGLRGYDGSESDVSGWEGGSFSELPICVEQWVGRCRVVGYFSTAAPGVW